MTSLLERIIAFFAPHWCIVCGKENNLLCDPCSIDAFPEIDSFCALCARPTTDWRLCDACTRRSGIAHVWVAADYDGVPADLIKRFKFERAKAAAAPLAASITATLPFVDPDTLVVPLSTAASRRRQRGYDQSVLIARHVARERSLRLSTPLLHVGKSRQVGATRAQRIAQAKAAYTIVDPSAVKGASILLIDDICTTGASLMAASKLLRRAGAREINAAVVAHGKQEK